MSTHTFRGYDAQRDRDHCLRIMQEIGWADDADEAGKTWDPFSSDTDIVIAEVDRCAESFALGRAGTMRYVDDDLPMSHVVGVGTSRVARRRGYALGTTARVLMNAAESGAAVGRLGIFDQGFYDRLGFGTLPYLRLMTIDPSQLRVPACTRTPVRLGADDAVELHACRCRRLRRHGGVNMSGAGITRCEFEWIKGMFALGFRSDEGTLTHHVAVKPKGEHGPYEVRWFAYETAKQFLELLGLLKSMGDQVHGFRMVEPPHVQLQDLVEQPFRMLRSRRKGEFDVNPVSLAWEQVRMLDLEACVAAVRLPGETVSFTLAITDPIERYLPDDSRWRGVSGTWTVTLGPESRAEPIKDAGPCDVCATVAAFSRLWIGAQPASALAISGGLAADARILDDIDRVLRLPCPAGDWDA